MLNPEYTDRNGNKSAGGVTGGVQRGMPAPA